MKDENKLLSSNNSLSLNIVFIERFGIFHRLCLIKDITELGDGEFMAKDTPIDKQHKTLTELEKIGLGFGKVQDQSINL